MIVSAVAPGDVAKIWLYVKGYLEKAIETSPKKYHVDDIYHLTQSGLYGLWVIIDEDTDEIVAAYTTRIIEYPNRRALALDWLGGKRMNEWLQLMHDTAKVYGRHKGCRHMEGYGRIAWKRVLQKVGWDPAYICYEVEI